MRKPTLRSSALIAAVAMALGLTSACNNTPAPFDPAADCPKLENCGQCASRGACAWCGDATKGQCMAVGHSECANNAWSKTPEVCPTPPATGNLKSASTSSDGDSEEKKAVGPEKWNGIERALRKAFPNSNVTPTVVDGVVRLLLHNLDGKRERAPVTKHAVEKDHKLYMGHADHHRVKSMAPASKGMQSEFVMMLPMVRVSLPDKIDAEHPVVETEIGDVDLSRDHLLGSVDLVASKYADAQHLGYRPARVDLITPARLAHGRFGAIAVYLGYKNKNDRGPSFYLLEAGTATGDAKMIYYSPNMAPITSVTSYYLPTPFVTLANTYSGGITMQGAPNEDEPDTLVVRSHAVGEKDPYITVTVKYQRSPTMDVAAPIELTADAGARVALIANTMGIPNAEDLQQLLAKLANDLYWKQSPHYTEGAPASTAAPTATANPVAPPPR